MDRSSKDGLDGMVVIFQTILQCYAGSVIERSRDEMIKNVGAAVAGEEAKADPSKLELPTDSCSGSFFKEMLRTNPEAWDALLSSLPDGVTFDELLGEIQKTIEGVVLGESVPNPFLNFSVVCTVTSSTLTLLPPLAPFTSLYAAAQSMPIIGCAGLENGSMGQRVQAEFLREMVTRVDEARQSSEAEV